FGDAYEFLIGMYASNAGKSGGEYFTPQEVSKLLMKLAMYEHETLDGLTVYDPACGSGSLLLQAKRFVKNNDNIEKYCGQEINLTTYNLARMNMFLNDVSYSKFEIANGDTLIDDKFKKLKFDIVVSNPPYSLK
ncbi:N-6 DNA methylase, partial [bacterium]|nr:N-6 DNA methylase [bacterium]